MEFYDVINNRYSVRSYKPDPVEKEKLDRILQTGIKAPTAANKQAFKIIVIDTGKNEEELKQIYSRDWFVQAPLVLAVLSIPEKAWVRKDDDKNYSDVDAAIVMDHIILAATAEGLGTCWVGAFDSEAVKKVLCIPTGMEAIAFTPLGYTASSMGTKKRKSQDLLVEYR